MRTYRHNAAFTLTELLVAIAVLMIIVSISILTFRNISNNSALRIATQVTYSSLTTAWSDTLASEGDTVYGVHFERGSTTVFTGQTYSASDPDNIVYTFPGGAYASSSLITSNTDVVFRRLTGLPSATGTIEMIRSDGNATNTITIHNTGLIEI